MSGARPQSKPPQRWPDIMIAVLTLALLGGFGALLLDQKPKATTSAPPVSTTAPTAAIPASPGTVPPPVAVTPPTTEPAAQAPASGTPTSGTQTSDQNPAAQNPATQATAPASSSPASSASATPVAASAVESTSQIPPVPKAPPVQAITPPVLPEKTTGQPDTTTTEATTGTPKTTDAASTNPATTTTQPSTSQPAPVAVAPRSGGAVATLADRTPLRSEYRISLGSFSTSRTVQTQTSAVSGLGYKVHTIDLGSQYVAQIGPFADEETARQALADIQRAYPGALLYRPRAKASDTSTSDSNNATSESSRQMNSNQASSNQATGNQASSTAANSPAPAPDGPRYLQVGAFDRPESAQKLVGILRDHDFAPTVSSPPDSKTTVMVGPYSGGALLRAETRLDNAGLDHFRVR